MMVPAEDSAKIANVSGVIASVFGGASDDVQVELAEEENGAAEQDSGAVVVCETKADFDDLVANNEKVVVDFTATWCGPCKSIAPVFASLATANPGIKFVKVDVDTNAETSDACGIKSMPSFFFYQGGEKIDAIAGANEGALTSKIEKLFA